MLARTLGYGLSGVSGFAVKVEVYAATGMPALEIIGLPDASVKESRDRVSAAIVNSGFTMPISRLTVNLAPADQRKEGPAFDLPIAISILMASGQLEGMDLTQTLMLGELSLDGSLHPVRGAAESSAEVGARVRKVRELQQARYAQDGIHCNAQLDAGLSKKYCPMTPEATALLHMAVERMGMSMRAYGRVVKVARTIADMDGADTIGTTHVAEAIQYRELDGKYWKG